MLVVLLLLFVLVELYCNPVRMRGLKPLDGVVSVRVLLFKIFNGLLECWVVDDFLFRGCVL